MGVCTIQAERIQTEQTSIEVQAGANAPRLVKLEGSGGEAWLNDAAEKLIDVGLSWKFNPQASHVDSRRIAFVYDSAQPRLRLTWEWKAPVSTGPIEHTIRIENLESKEIWLPLQDSFQFLFSVKSSLPLKQLYIEKGADKPSAAGTHELPLPVGYRWTGASSTYAHPPPGQPREIIPWFAVESEQGGWYTGVEFSGRIRLALERDALSLHGTVGLNPEPGPFRTRLKPHEIFETPTIFVGAFHGGLDALGNVLRPWVRQALNPHPWQNPQFPMAVNNSWGSGMQVDEPLARRMIHDSAELGLEMFHLDAGWFRGVGDWYPDLKKFPRGLAIIADEAHRQGLMFGLWVDWTQAALDQQPGALNLRDPEVRNWTVSDLPAEWKPEEFKGQTIDLGVPAAHDYATREVQRIVAEYHLDMLEHDGYLVAQGCVREDHPHAPPDLSRMSVVNDGGAYIVESSNSTDVSYHAVRAYYDIYANLRRQHPNLLLEICNDGGRMVDFGSATHGDYFSITDAYDPLSNRQAFYDASHVLPPAMLEAYVQKWPAPSLENFRYMLRSGMMGWLTIMLDTTAWDEQQHAAAKQEIRLYREKLRPFIRDADLYHISERPNGVDWDGIEYFDQKRGKGVVYIFRGSTETKDKHSFRLQGVRPTRQYRLHFNDGSAADRTASGRDLAGMGLAVTLPVPNSSELIFIEGAVH
jgi:hypothetical protein